MTMKAKLKRISGPGIEGTEHCPPCYHVDFEPDEFALFLENPIKVLGQLGYKITHPNIVFSRWHEAWSHTKQDWVPVHHHSTEARLPPAIKGCCYISNDSVICHQHS